MTNAENFDLLKECYGMGRGSDFCWGRCLVIDQCDDISRDWLQRLCRFGGHNISEVLAGVEYQKSIFRAAAMLVRGANRELTMNTRNTRNTTGRAGQCNVGMPE